MATVLRDAGIMHAEATRRLAQEHADNARHEAHNALLYMKRYVGERRFKLAQVYADEAAYHARLSVAARDTERRLRDNGRRYCEHHYNQAHYAARAGGPVSEVRCAECHAAVCYCLCTRHDLAICSHCHEGDHILSPLGKRSKVALH